MVDLWEYENPIADYDIDVPQWIDQDISPKDVAAIIQGGCESGAYMPAVICHEATKTMAEHGDDVLQFIQDVYGELPKPSDELPKPFDDESWSGMACFYLSAAVELWAAGIEEEVGDAIEDQLEGAE